MHIAGSLGGGSLLKSWCKQLQLYPFTPSQWITQMQHGQQLSHCKQKPPSQVIIHAYTLFLSFPRQLHSSTYLYCQLSPKGFRRTWLCHFQSYLRKLRILEVGQCVIWQKVFYQATDHSPFLWTQMYLLWGKILFYNPLICWHFQPHCLVSTWHVCCFPSAMEVPCMRTGRVALHCLEEKNTDLRLYVAYKEDIHHVKLPYLKCIKYLLYSFFTYPWSICCMPIQTFLCCSQAWKEFLSK